MTPKSVSANFGFERRRLVAGKFTQPFLDKYPVLAKTPEIFPEIHIANPDQPKALIVIAGFKDEHTNRFLRDYGAKFAKKTKDTLIVVEWSRQRDVFDVRWGCLADYLSQNHPAGVKLLGISIGGREVLNALKKFKQLSVSGFNVPVETVITVVAPLSKETLQPRKMIGTKTWLMLRLAQKAGLLVAVITILRPSDKAEVLRVREFIQGKPFKKGDFLKGQVVHYFGTDEEGVFDPLVNQPKAIKQLESAGITVKEHWYEPDLNRAHYPTQKELDRLVSDALLILGQTNS